MKPLALCSLVLSLFVIGCGAAPSAPSSLATYTPPSFAPGQCIVGTSSNCVNQIPTPPPPAAPAPPAPSLNVSMSCSQDDSKLVVTCSFSARNETGQVWTSHISHEDFDWGDGTPVDHNGGFFMTHTYTRRGSFSIGGFVFDDRGVSGYVNGSISTLTSTQ